MDVPPDGVETDLVDLTDLPISALPHVASDVLSTSIRRVLAQVERPRANIGGSGPPGRAD